MTNFLTFKNKKPKSVKCSPELLSPFASGVDWRWQNFDPLLTSPLPPLLGHTFAMSISHLVEKVSGYTLLSGTLKQHTILPIFESLVRRFSSSENHTSDSDAICIVPVHTIHISWNLWYSMDVSVIQVLTIS